MEMFRRITAPLEELEEHLISNVSLNATHVLMFTSELWWKEAGLKPFLTNKT